jgi:cell division protein FtsL
MLVVRNSNKQIIYVLKITIFLMLSYFSSTYVRESLFAIKNEIKSKERKVLTNKTIAACVSLRMTKV